MTGVAPERLSPYRGLAAFGDSDLDARLFFGRDRETEIVAANLQASRLTVLYGASGVGKTSLLRAGVTHRLRANGHPEAARHVVAVCSNWSGDPLAAVAAAVADALTGFLGESVEVTPGRPLADELEDWCAALDGEIYMVLDQLEEYVLYHGADRGGPLAEALAEVVSRPSLRVGVLLGIRDDALAQLDAFKTRVPALFGNLLRLDHLSRDEGREAIVGPLAELSRLGAAQVTAERELVTDVLDQVATGRIGAGEGLGLLPDAPVTGRIEAPYLQLVMERLWEVERERGSSTLRAATLAELGGATRIVEEHLERALASLDDDGRALSGAVFGFLVTPSGTKIAHRADDLARYTEVATASLRPVLDGLAQQRILRHVPDEAGGESRYEIFHDVLAGATLEWTSQYASSRAIEVERRRRRRAIEIAAGVVAVAVLLVAVAAFAVAQRGRAGEESRDATARRLDASAAAVLSTDPELSLLLAAESARLSAGPTSEDALRNALIGSGLRAVFDLGAPAGDVVLAHDARTLGAASVEGSVRVWDVRSRRLLFEREVGAGGGVSFVSDDTLILHGAVGSPVAVSRTGEPVCTYGDAAVADAAGTGTLVVLSSGAVFDARSCRRVSQIGGIAPGVTSVVPSSDGRRAACVRGAQATVVDVPSGRTGSRLRHPSAIRRLVFGADGSRAVTAAHDSLVARVWDVASGGLERELAGHVGDVGDVAVDPSGAVVVTGSNDGQARVWDANTGIVQTVLSGHVGFVDAVDITDDAGFVVTGTTDRTARTWTTTARLVAILAGHTDAVTSAFFSPDGATVITGSDDGTVRLWDSGAAPDLVAADLDPPAAPQLVATSPDGALVARADGANLRLERRGGKTIELSGHEDLITSVAFSADGQRLVTASRDNDAILWDAEQGTLLRVLRAHFGPVFDARFSPDGRWIVTAGPTTAGLWNASNGAFLRFLRAEAPPPPRRARKLAIATFTADSRTIVTVARDGTVSRYRCDICGETSELLALAEQRLRATGRGLTSEERALYLG